MGISETMFAGASFLPFACATLICLLLAVMVSSASAAFGRHGLVRFYCFWPSQSPPLLLLLAVTVSSASLFLCFWPSGLVRFYCFWKWPSASIAFGRHVSSASTVLAVRVSSASTVYGRQRLVGFYCFWPSASRPLLLFLAVTVSSASTV